MEQNIQDNNKQSAEEPLFNIVSVAYLLLVCHLFLLFGLISSNKDGFGGLAVLGIGLAEIFVSIMSCFVIFFLRKQKRRLTNLLLVLSILGLTGMFWADALFHFGLAWSPLY